MDFLLSGKMPLLVYLLLVLLRSPWTFPFYSRVCVDIWFKCSGVGHQRQNKMRLVHAVNLPSKNREAKLWNWCHVCNILSISCGNITADFHSYVIYHFWVRFCGLFCNIVRFIIKPAWDKMCYILPILYIQFTDMVQYIPRNMHTVFALLCFVVVIHWLIFPYPSGLLHWHCGNLTIAPVPAKQPWWIWINTSCEVIMNDCITTTKQSTTIPCAYFLGYTVHSPTQTLSC